MNWSSWLFDAERNIHQAASAAISDGMSLESLCFVQSHIASALLQLRDANDELQGEIRELQAAK